MKTNVWSRVVWGMLEESDLANCEIRWRKRYQAPLQLGSSSAETPTYNRETRKKYKLGLADSSINQPLINFYQSGWIPCNELKDSWKGQGLSGTRYAQKAINKISFVMSPKCSTLDQNFSLFLCSTSIPKVKFLNKGWKGIGPIQQWGKQ